MATSVDGRYPANRKQEITSVESKGPQVPGIAHARQSKAWRMMEALRSTETMRQAGTEYLPQEEREPALAYHARLERSFLYPAARKAVEAAAAKVFSRDVTVGDQDSLPEELQALRDDADGCGCNLTQVARSVFDAGVSHGHAHILVDSPALGGESRRTQRAAGMHPYLSLVKAPDLLGFKSLRLASGREVLTQVRIRELRVVENGEWGEEEREMVRVINAPELDPVTGRPVAGAAPGTFQLYGKKGDTDDYEPLDGEGMSGQHAYPGVPLVTFYAKRLGFMVSEPPLLELAWLNVAHWQSASDQRSLLRFARVPMLALYGFSPEEAGALTVGAGLVALRTDRAPDQARAEYIDPRGVKALESGSKDIEHLEQQMVVLGMAPFVQKVGNVTATARGIDEARSQSDVHAWAGGLDMALEEAYRAAARYLREGDELPEGFSVQVFKDFGVTLRSEGEVDQMLKMFGAGALDHRTLLDEMKRRGVLSDGVNVEDVIERAGLGEMPDSDEAV